MRIFSGKDKSSIPPTEVFFDTTTGVISSSRLRCTTRPSKLPLVLPTHLHSISRPLATLPEAPSSFPTHQTAMTNPTILGTVVLLSGTVTTNHAVGPFVMMLLSFIVTFVARVDFLATAESKPSIRLCIVTTTSSLGKLGASYETKCFFLAARLGCGREMCKCDSQEFDIGDLKRELGVTLTTDIRG
jgi:hypothetical protein